MPIFDILSCLFHWWTDKIKLKLCLLYLGNDKNGKVHTFFFLITISDGSAANRRECFKWKNMAREKPTYYFYNAKQII